MPRTVPTRSLYDTLACTDRVGSPAAANSSTQKVRAKKPGKSRCGSIRTSTAPLIASGSKRISPPGEVADHEPWRVVRVDTRQNLQARVRRRNDAPRITVLRGAAGITLVAA